VLYSVRDFFAENREVNGAQISSLWRVCRIYSELCQALDNVYDTLYDVALIKTLEYQIGSTPDSGRENRLELLDLTDST
jgi:hypothetical protein